MTQGSEPHTDLAISVKGVSKRYRTYRKPSHKLAEALWNTFLPRPKTLSREFWALTDVNLEVRRGTTTGIIGRNGAGKSTLLQIITGVLQPTRGEVQVHGRVAALLELGAGFNREFTGRENVFLQGAVMGIAKKEMQSRLPAIEAFAEIGEFIDQPVRTYSSGMYVRLAFAVAINVDADILIVDEALAVGDDMFRRRCYSRLEELQRNGKTILFVSHSIQSIISLCTEAILIDSGRSLFVGEPKEAVYRYNELLADLEERRRPNEPKLKQISVSLLNGSAKKSLGERRYGNKGAELLAAIIEDDQGQPIRVIATGDHFIVRVRVVFRKATEEPNIGFSILTLKGIEVHGTSTHLAEKPIGPVAAGEVVTVRFRQRNILGPDSYSLSVAVADMNYGNRVFQDRQHEVLTFKVVGARKTYGLVNLESEVDTNRSTEL